MNRISENTLKELASKIVDSIEENMGVGGIAAVGPAQAGNSFGSLGGVGSVGTGAPMPNGVGNAQAKGGAEAKSKEAPAANAQQGKNDYGKLPKQSEIQVMALVNQVNGPLGRKSGSVGNVPPASVTVSGVKATIDQIGKGKK